MTNGRRLDLVLVHPGSRSRVYQSLGDSITAIETPVWATILAAFILNRGYSVHIIDAEAEDLSPETTAQRIKEIDPLLTAVVIYGHQPSASTQYMSAAGELCTSLKQNAPDLTTVMVGGHVAALPERTLREEDADFVAGGEGPYTVLDLLEALSTPRPDYTKVRGLYYREGQAIRSNPAAPLLQNLDQEIPAIDWSLIPVEKYRAHNWQCFGNIDRQPYAAIYTTLGCPYHCSFCCIQAPFKDGEKASGMALGVNSYRFWSPQWVINQIDVLVNEYGVRNIRVSDEMFVLNQRHVHQICDLIIERGYDLNMWAYTRVDTIRSDETLDKLKKAGFHWLCFGFESANETVRDDVDKGYGQDAIYKIVDKVKAVDISILANYVFGLPEDNMETMQETLDMAVDLNCEFANLYSGMAYPGSQLYNLAIEKKWPLPETWLGYSQHSVDSLPLPTNYLTSAEVLRFRDHAFQVYHSSPRYLDMIDRKFGPDSVRHIKEMSSHKLVRNHA